MLLEQGGFTPKNVQPDKTGKLNLPICPFYNVIDIAAQFAGMSSDDLSNDPRFCGYKVTYEDTLSILSGHRGRNYYPKTSCTEVRDKLNEQLRIVSEDYHVPSTDDLKHALDAAQDSKEKEEILILHTQSLRLSEQKEQILSLWRGTVYEMSVVPEDGDSEADPHFQRRSIDDIQDDEAVSYVKKIISALEEQVTGPGSNIPEGRIILGSTSARHCPQTPRFHKTGEIS